MFKASFIGLTILGLTVASTTAYGLTSISGGPTYKRVDSHHISGDYDIPVLGGSADTHIRTLMDLNETDRVNQLITACVKREVKIEFMNHEYGCIVSKSGRVWLDRNTGASRVAQELRDSRAWGGFFQWGRVPDGHEYGGSLYQKNRSRNTPTSPYPGAWFGAPQHMLYDFDLNDWSDDDPDGTKRQAYWSTIDGTAVCPAGFRVPTIREWDVESKIWGEDSESDWHNWGIERAFNSNFKLPLPGFLLPSKEHVKYHIDKIWKYRTESYTVNHDAFYWASDPGTNELYEDTAKALYFYWNENPGHGETAAIKRTTEFNRVKGGSVRCIMDESIATPDINVSAEDTSTSN
ncbi:MAG: fibrobacter succinogenes major paralogous domain-containing protein [Sulfurovum sp.]|nr:fibrobacter succinogenes major paralogous domain-containing protein [Sulfurovum sp.]MCB4773586.1 fibrobacter succinogenes major paralogous domain-containing protein [Sulfurovum sp.]MCB4784521.1 fibrobacter succinogenes major paralogous domain-containing protein [Sulfurovum sp.]